jgi:hypothetical protein
VNLTVPGFFGLLLILLSFSLIVVFAAAGRNRPGRHLRELPAFTRLRRAVGLAVEVGTRVHISLGRGDLLGTQNAAAFSGLVMADRIARAASISDRPPVATAGSWPRIRSGLPFAPWAWRASSTPIPLNRPG